MSLPAERQIGHGRTHSQRWDALDYACAVKGARAVFPLARIYKALVLMILAVLLVPLVLHVAVRVMT